MLQAFHRCFIHDLNGDNNWRALTQHFFAIYGTGITSIWKLGKLNIKLHGLAWNCGYKIILVIPSAIKCWLEICCIFSTESLAYSEKYSQRVSKYIAKHTTHKMCLDFHLWETQMTHTAHIISENFQIWISMIIIQLNNIQYPCKYLIGWN